MGFGDQVVVLGGGREQRAVEVLGRSVCCCVYNMYGAWECCDSRVLLHFLTNVMSVFCFR